MPKKIFPCILSFVLVAALLGGLFTPFARTYGQGGCGTAPPPRLVVGGQARVTFTDGTPLRVRAAPGLAGAQVTQLPEGTGFQVVNGPVCADNYYWWQIQNGTVSGWIAEGDSTSYFAEPLGTSSVPASAPTTTPPGVVMPLASGTGPFSVWDWATYIAGHYDTTIPDPMALQLPSAYAGNLPALPVDLGAVKFVDDAKLNDAQKALLAKNGFVVVPAGLDQFYKAYQEGDVWTIVPSNFDMNADPNTQDIGHAYFVTTDSMLHALHYVFDNLLTDLEKNEFQPVMVNNVLIPTLQAAHVQTQAAQGTALAGPAANAELFLTVALALFSPDDLSSVASPDMIAAAQPIVDMATAGQGQLAIPFMPSYIEDFSQYRPRGHYTDEPLLEQYFRGMMWVSRITFVADDDTATQMALMLLRALRTAPGAGDAWNNIHQTLTFLIGPVDDLGLPEYSPLADQVFGTDLSLANLANPALLASFKTEVTKLPGPRINSMVLPNDTQAGDITSETRGFRFLGQRFTFDGFVMQQLMYPYVGTRENPRALPLGLDIPTVMGPSAVAYNLAGQAGATGFANYDSQINMLRASVGALTNDNWLENLYGGWLWTLKPLWGRDAVVYPPMMNTEAWLRKDLQTGLGSWTELKHDTVLYAKQPGGFGGGGPPLDSYGYVEPNPLVFARIAIVAAMTYQGISTREVSQPIPTGYNTGGGRAPGNLRLVRQGNFTDLDASLGALKDLSFQAANLAEMARKELNGEALTESDYWTILGYSEYLYVLLYTLYQGDNPKPVALVTDVANNTGTKTVLQEGVGGVDYIYVVIPNPRGGYQIVRGGVFSYYEWVGNIDQRMTDEEWRAKVTSGDLPPRPGWVSEFFSP